MVVALGRLCRHWFGGGREQELRGYSQVGRGRAGGKKQSKGGGTAANVHARFNPWPCSSLKCAPAIYLAWVQEDPQAIRRPTER